MEPDVPFSSTRDFTAHGHSCLWTPEILWLNVVPDLLMALAYFSIPFILLVIAGRRRDLPFNSLFLWCGVFTGLCALMHAMSVWNVWHTQYWLEALLKLATAAALLPVAFALWRAWPAIVQSPGQKQLRHANELLARANRELEAFTASVSHDLRSPLSTIAGQAGMLELSLGNTVNEQQRERLTRIQASVKKMSELIEALLVLSRISRHTLHREILDVSALAADVVGDLRQASPGRSVDVVIQPGMTAHGDRRLIGDMLANLIGNAWKFTSKTTDARIEIGQQTAGHMATFFVRDNGAGFDMAYEQKLFKPFQRLHGASEFEGSGIGLATVQRIVERHGGRVWAESRPGHGALFCFTLPTLPLSDATVHSSIGT